MMSISNSNSNIMSIEGNSMKMSIEANSNLMSIEPSQIVSNHNEKYEECSTSELSENTEKSDEFSKSNKSILKKNKTLENVCL
jgi:hypothetical protein